MDNKRMRHVAIISALMCLVTALTACAGGEADDEALSVDGDAVAEGALAVTDIFVARDDYEASLEKASFSNLTFAEDFTLVIPDATTLSRFELTAPSETLSKDEMCDLARKVLEEHFADIYSEDECEALIESASIRDDMFFLENDAMGLTIYATGYVHAYNRGVALALDEMPSPATVYFPADSHGVLAEYSGDSLASDDSYTLTDGEWTVAAAVDSANALLSAESAESSLDYVVTNVYPVSINDDTTVYQMSATRFYADVPFSADKTSSSGFNYRLLAETEEEEKDYNFLPVTLVLAQHDTIDFQIALDNTQEITEIATYESCLAPDVVMQMASDYLSNGVTFTAQSLSLCYCDYTVDDDTTHVDPMWKLTLYNPNDALTYVFFFDSQTGEADGCGYCYGEE